MLVFEICCWSVTSVALGVTFIYLAKAGKYQKSTAAYWEAGRLYQNGDQAAGDQTYARGRELERKAERFARWLPS